MGLANKERRVICPMCNFICMQLVPLYDNDNEHKKQQCCRDCKRRIKNDIPIKKFTGRRDDE